MEFECDRCSDGVASVAIWDDDVLCGRIDAICGECYDRGERIHRPIEPPTNDDGELYWHKKYVGCPLCEGEHVVDIGDSIAVCRYAMHHMDVDLATFDIHE